MAKKKKAIKRKASKKKVLKKKPAKRAPAKKSKIKKPAAKKAAIKKVRKPAVKKAANARKPQAKKPAKPKRPQKGFLGEITHYFPKVRAAVIKLSDSLSVGDRIKIKGHTTDFVQTVTSLQIDRVPIQVAKKGDEIGLQVDSRVRRGDQVTK